MRSSYSIQWERICALLAKRETVVASPCRTEYIPKVQTDGKEEESKVVVVGGNFNAYPVRSHFPDLDEIFEEEEALRKKALSRIRVVHNLGGVWSSLRDKLNRKYQENRTCVEEEDHEEHKTCWVVTSYGLGKSTLCMYIPIHLHKISPQITIDYFWWLSKSIIFLIHNEFGSLKQFIKAGIILWIIRQHVSASGNLCRRIAASQSMFLGLAPFRTNIFFKSYPETRKAIHR